MKRHEMEILRLRGVLADKVYAGPRNVNVHLTNVCNLACRYCSFHRDEAKSNARLQSRQEISRSVFKKLIDDCAFLGVDEIGFSGEGEPLMHTSIEDLMEHVHKRKVRLSVNTNCSIKNNSAVNALNLATNVNIHLSAVDANGYAKIQSRNKAVFEQVMKNWTSIVELKGNNPFPLIHIIFILNRNNFTDIGKLVDLACKLKARSIKFRMVKVTAETKDLSIGKDILGDFKKVITDVAKSKKIYKIKTNIAYFYRLLLSTEFKEKNEDLFYKGTYSRSFYYNRIFEPGFQCFNGWYYAFVNLWGDVYNCCHNRQFPIGNINKTPFKKIWIGKDAAKIRLILRDQFDINNKYWTECNLCTSVNFNKDIASLVKAYPEVNLS